MGLEVKLIFVKKSTRDFGCFSATVQHFFKLFFAILIENHLSYAIHFYDLHSYLYNSKYSVFSTKFWVFRTDLPKFETPPPLEESARNKAKMFDNLVY